jgi:hypothetical protein
MRKCVVGLVVPWNALIWVGSSVLTSASLRSTLEMGVLAPKHFRPKPRLGHIGVGMGLAGPTKKNAARSNIHRATKVISKWLPFRLSPSKIA